MGLLASEVALITGGGRGFGLAIAKTFAAEGARVAICSRSPRELESAAAEIRALGGVAFSREADVTDPAAVSSLVHETKAALGPISILVNNAGAAGPFGPIGTVDADQWWKALELHARAPMMLMDAVLPGMLSRRHGRIIIIASLAGAMVVPNLSAYCIGKSVQLRLAEHVGAEVRSRGVSVFAIEPGSVFTDMARQAVGSPEARRWAPDLVAFMENIGRTDDPAVGLDRCASRCLDLASGRYDALSGRYLTPEDSLDRLLAGALTTAA